MKVTPSLTLAITAKARKMKEQGVDVVSLAAGEPDTLPPEPVKDAAIQAVRDNFVQYTAESGISELKEAVVKKFRRDNGLDYKTDNIIVSNGAKQVLFNAIFALGPGDFVVPVPFWLTYPEQIKMANSKTVFCRTENNQFKADLIAEKITKDTKGIILNSPNNPSGAVVSRAELKRIADLALSHKIMVLSDEVYEYFAYDEEHVSIASLGSEIKKKTVTINSLSKSSGVPGWRIGYAGGPVDLIKDMSAIQSHVTSNPCSIAQKAAVKALDFGKNPAVLKEYRERRDLMVEGLNSVGLHCQKPAGAFYCWVKIDGDSMDFCSRLLEQSKVAIIPGEPFGMKDYVRLSYAVPKEKIKEAIKRIKIFLA